MSNETPKCSVVWSIQNMLSKFKEWNESFFKWVQGCKIEFQALQVPWKHLREEAYNN